LIEATVEIEVSEDDVRHSTTHDVLRGLLPARDDDDAPR